MEIYFLDSFTDVKYGGNKAAVAIVQQWPEDKMMQNIAKEVGFSETAFVKQLEKDVFQVRFFTPLAEVDLCGHATIASFQCLIDIGILSKDIKKAKMIAKAGHLEINIDYSQDKPIILMEQAKPRFEGEIRVTDTQDIAMALGIEVEDIGIDFMEGVQPKIASTGLRDIICPIRSIDKLKNISPDFGKIKGISSKHDVVGIHCIYIEDNKGESINIWARNFAPLLGIDEEPATGTASGASVAYLINNNVITEGQKTIFNFNQGIWMNKESKITAKVTATQDQYKVWIGGRAVMVMKGTWII